MGKLVLEVLKGADKGLHIEVSEERWLVVGRSKIIDQTVVVPQEEMDEAPLRLEEEEITILKAHHRRQGRKKISKIEKNRDRDVYLMDDTVSRVHAVLYNLEGIAGVIDLASTNGVYFDTEKVDAAELREGGLLGLGNVHLQVKSAP